MSFVGFAPVEDPQVLVYVIVDNPVVPEGESVSSTLAVNIERQLMEKIVAYMNIETDGTVVGETVEISEVSAEGVEEESETEFETTVYTSDDEVIPAEGYLSDEISSLEEDVSVTREENGEMETAITETEAE